MALGVCKGPKRCRQFFKLSSLGCGAKFILRAVFCLNINVESRPPLGGIDDGTSSFAQHLDTALFGNDREQGMYGLEKLWPLGACKGQQHCRQFYKLRSLGLTAHGWTAHGKVG
ncbi:MAG: hypothetical protein ACREOO_09250 [bacterium]